MLKYLMSRTLYQLSILALFLLILGFADYLRSINTNIKNIPKLKENQAIVILTGGSNRIYEGLKLSLEANYNKLPIFISGVGKNFSLEKNIEFQKLQKENTNTINLIKKINFGDLATTTELNAFETYAWMKFNKINNIILVTSKYHMQRSVIEFERFIDKEQIQPYIVDSNVLANSNLLDFPHSIKLLFTEYIKLITIKLFYILDDVTEYIWGKS